MQWLLDLGLNIFSEIIGIALTVFFVDRIIKNREEKRWLRSRNFIYVRLLRFSSATAISLVTLTTHQLKRNIYSFGGVVVSCNEFDVKLNNESEKEIISSIRPKLEGMTIDHKISKAKYLYELLGELDTILSDIAQLIDPELLTILLELRESLVKMEDIELQLKIEKHGSVGGLESFEYGVWKILKNLELLNNSLLPRSESKKHFAIYPSIQE